MLSLFLIFSQYLLFIIMQSATMFGEKRKKTTNLQPRKTPESQLFQNIILKSHDKDEDLMQLKKSEFIKPKQKVQSQSPSLRIAHELLGKSITLRRRQSKESGYRKSNNINLSDYLTLYSMSKRSHRSLSKTNNTKSEDKKLALVNQTSLKSPRIQNAIDAAQSIKVIHDETKKEIKTASKNLSNFLKDLDDSEHIKQDEQSLVFMCNVLHIFEEKIMQSVKLAQQLVEERKRQKTNKSLKQYSKTGISSLIKGGVSRQKDKASNSKHSNDSSNRNNNNSAIFHRRRQ